MNKRGLDKLRRKAEENLATNDQKIKGMGKVDLATMAHDLAVHQAELEMQNEELLESRALVEETKERYQELFDFAPVGFFTLDEHNRIVEVNVTGYQLLKVDKGKLKNKIFTRFISDDETDSFYLQRKKALENELGQNFILKMKKADGTLFPAQLDIIKSGEGRLRLAISDITERKKAEDTQKQSEENYRTLFNSIDEGFCTIEVVFDNKGKPIDYRFLQINPAFERQTGLHDAEGKLMRSLAPDHEEHWFQIYGRIALTGKSERFINEAKALNRWYDVYAFRVGLPESRKVAILFNDITARKKAEDDLAKAKDELEIKVQERTAELKETGEQLRQRAEELETVMNVVPAAIWVAHDPACHNITGNQTANRFYEAEEGENVSAGPAPGEPVPERHFFRNGEELKAEELPMQQAAARNVDIEGSEFNVLLPSGKSRTLWGSASPLRNDDGQVRGVVAAFVDITDRMREQEKLKESENRFSKAFHSSPVGLSISKIDDGTFIDVNQSFLNLYRYKREELIGQKATELNIYDNPIDRKEIVRQLEQQGKVLNYEVTARTKSGAEINALTSAEKIEINGQAHVIWTTIDISGRKQAEDTIKTTLNRFYSVLSEMPLAILMVTENGLAEFANQVFCDMFNLKQTPEELKNLNAPEIIEIIQGALENPEKDLSRIAEIVRQGKLVKDEEVALRGNRIVLRDFVPLRLGENKYGRLWIHRDITERKNMEDALKESEAKANALIKYAPTGIFEIDYRKQRFVSINDAMSYLSGYSKEELFALGPGALLDEESQKLFAARIRRQLAGEKIDNSVEYRVKKKDGAILWVTLNIAFSNDNPDIALVIGHDITERIESEEKLKESEERYRALIDLAPDAILVHRDGNIYYSNTSALRLFGARTYEELAAHNILDLIHSDDRESARANIQTVEQGKTTVMTERRAIRLDGQQWVLEAAGTPVHWKNELCVQVMIRDITARKKTEEEVARLNRELSAINECNQVIVHASDEKALLFEVCRILCTTAGYRMAWIASVEHDEAKSVRPLAWYGDEGYIAKANITWADTERGQGPAGVAARIGRTHFFQDFATDPAAVPWRESALARGYRSSIAVPLFDSAGTVFGLFSLYSPEPNSFNPAEIRLLEGLAANISFGVSALREKMKRQQAEDEISHLASFSEYNPSPIVEVSAEGDIIYANPAANLRFPLVTQGQRREFLTNFIKAVNSAETLIAVKDVNVADYWYEETMAYVPSTKTYRLYGREITIRKKFEEELKQRTIDLETSNKELEAFSYSVSHDLRAPLRSITGFSTVLLEDYNDELDKEGKSYLKKISDAGELMGQLMDDLLKLSRVTRSDLNIEKLDLSEMARKIVSDFASDEPERKVKVTIAPHMTANGDKNLLGLVLQNLLGNAWKYSSKTAEPRIEMGTIAHNDKRAYFVRDNGVGFDMTYANKLFQPFQRLHKATEFAGTGIGLATVQRIIRRHGGEVWAESKVGEGATFYFTLN